MRWVVYKSNSPKENEVITSFFRKNNIKFAGRIGSADVALFFCFTLESDGFVYCQDKSFLSEDFKCDSLEEFKKETKKYIKYGNFYSENNVFI